MAKQRTLLIADIHGGYKSLIQCFERSNFSYTNDRLISLGDECDGFPETKQVINELLKIKNLIHLAANHTAWLLDYCLTGNKEQLWLEQGGYNTLKSYEGNIPKSHIEFLLKAKLYHTEGDILFIHGGIVPGSKVENNSKDTIIWDRELICNAYKKSNGRPNYRMQNIYNEIFVGHTTTGKFNKEYKPVKFCEINDLDSGGGWEGKLTIMDLETRQYWQSDFVKTLYPKSNGRKDYAEHEFYSKLFHQHP